MKAAAQAQTQAAAPTASNGFNAAGLQMQRKCACGEAAGLSGKCEGCQSERLTGKTSLTPTNVNETAETSGPQSPFDLSTIRLNTESQSGETRADSPISPLTQETDTSATADTEKTSPSQVGHRFSALAPSVQAESYAKLSTDIKTAFAHQATVTQAIIPDYSAKLEGTSEALMTPVITSPENTPSRAAQDFTRLPEPNVDIPSVPDIKPRINTEVMENGSTGASGDVVSLNAAMQVVDPAAPLQTTIDIPAIPLQGKTDPAALDNLESSAAEESGQLLASAKESVASASPEVVQPQAVNETIAGPQLPEVPSPEHVLNINGMDQFVAYGFKPQDRAYFDEQFSPTLQTAPAATDSELARNEAEFEQQREQLQLDADAQASAAQTEAQTKQNQEVERGRASLVAEQHRTFEEQQLAVDDTLGELAASKQASRDKIDARLASDRAAVDGIYADAETKAKAEVEQGRVEVGKVENDTAEKTNDDSWLNWAMDQYQSVIQTMSGWIIGIWNEVAARVKGFFNKAMQLATKVVNGAVAFIKYALSAYYGGWTWLINKLLGDLFPGLAAKLTGWIENLKSALFATLDFIAEGYLNTLCLIADTLVKTLYLGLEAYKTTVNTYLTFLEEVQNGEWNDTARMVLSAFLRAAGIDPEAFFATFTKIDEIIDDIVANPKLVVTNAIDALALGMTNFGYNFPANFSIAFLEWITGSTGIKMPESFGLAGIFDVARQILHLDEAYLRKKAEQHLGAKAVTAIEETYEYLKTLVAEGWGGLWKLVKDKLTGLIGNMVQGITTWIMEKAILVAGRWIAGLISTMGFSLIVEGLIALWQFVMWVKDQFVRFWQIFQSTVDSIHDFVKGYIEPAAEKIEGTLQDLIVPAIDLVAKLLNIGNIAKKVTHFIEAVRKKIDEAIDGVIEGVKKRLGFGKKGEKEGKKKEDKDGESRHGKISLAMLKEPPVPVKPKRTKEDMEEDLEVAHKVLELAEDKVEDTAELAEYFNQIKKRFRLKKIGFDTVSGGKLGVQMQINPKGTDLLNKGLQGREPDISKGEDRMLKKIKTKVNFEDQAIKLNGEDGNPTRTFKVGKRMEADPVGPDHPKGQPTGSDLNDIMNYLPTKGDGVKNQRKRYVKGHMLHEDVGGPNSWPNLFPITEYLNVHQFRPGIEDWVKKRVHEHYYVYYLVEAKIDKSHLTAPQIIHRYVDSTITTEAGFYEIGSDGQFQKPDPSRRKKDVFKTVYGQSTHTPETPLGEEPPAGVNAAQEMGMTSISVSSNLDGKIANAVGLASKAAVAARDNSSFVQEILELGVIGLSSTNTYANDYSAKAEKAADAAQSVAEKMPISPKESRIKEARREAEEHAAYAQYYATLAKELVSEIIGIAVEEGKEKLMDVHIDFVNEIMTLFRDIRTKINYIKKIHQDLHDKYTKFMNGYSILKLVYNLVDNNDKFKANKTRYTTTSEKRKYIDDLINKKIPRFRDKAGMDNEEELLLNIDKKVVEARRHLEHANIASEEEAVRLIARSSQILEENRLMKEEKRDNATKERDKVNEEYGKIVERIGEANNKHIIELINSLLAALKVLDDFESVDQDKKSQKDRLIGRLKDALSRFNIFI